MDWIQVGFLLLFIVLPLLQGLAGRMRRPPADGEPSASLPEIATREPDAAPVDDTSAWDAWFEPHAGGAEQVEAGQGEERLAEEIHPVEAISLEQFDEAPPPVVLERVVHMAAPEPVEIDRDAEHVRFHSRFPAAVQPPPRSETLPERLRRPGELRRAIILAEVLGPPRSLR
ncbi:MAG: hypothetical protein M3497_09855 [Gemmatimonadota bacterium]|nr:hypothetical protein [Gemmatimonadota bacterium]